MNAAVQRFLDDVWSEMITIYNKETIRINEFIGNRPLQAGIKDYLQVAWRDGKYILMLKNRSIGRTALMKSKQVLISPNSRMN